jgi:hypothetical protein
MVFRGPKAPPQLTCVSYGLSLHPPSCCRWAAGVSEVSRFSRMKLPDVSGVYDYAGLNRSSRYRSRSCCLPPSQKRRRPDCIFFEAQYPPIPLFTLRAAPHDTVRKTRSRVVRYSFLVGLLHSLLPAGLSRRTYSAISHQLTTGCSPPLPTRRRGQLSPTRWNQS